MPAVLVDVGYHLVEPNTSGQAVSLSVVSTDANDLTVAGFDLRAQIVTTKEGPYFQSVQFAGDLWNSFPHVERGGPFPSNPTLASGDVAFTQGFEARADGTLVTLTIDTTGIPAGSYEFRLVGTQIGSSKFRRADGSGVSEIITNGTLQVRSIWQNPDNPSDVNGDGRISPLDVLLLLNELSKRGSHPLQMPSPGEEPESFFDTNGDGHLSPTDPLGVINCLNGLGCVTTPVPILAKATPDFPDPATSGAPDPKDVGSKDVPPDGKTDCEYDYFDEEGNPVPSPDPDSGDCVPSYIIDPDTVPVETNENEYDEFFPDPDAVVDQTPGVSGQGIALTPSAANNGISTTLFSSSSVDAVIVDLTDELDDKSSSDELVDLGLRSVFDGS